MFGWFAALLARKTDLDKVLLDKAFENALQRGKLLTLTEPPMKLRLQVAMQHHLRQGGEGLIRASDAADAAFQVFKDAVGEILKP